ncbi:hypothetical protein NDU88_001623 [Pleurodeles waltl]|uniref:Uncharacterized protein n=1 Tax=Pleurodeles waltl TaxID=8319 RepID=A0AAV7WIZ9_PLEWA|nr:hypothetical protein NDU88_001623 [Pleurodeles waltl]
MSNCDSTEDDPRRKVRRVALEKELIDLETVHKRTGTQKMWRELERMRLLLKCLDQDRAEYAILRLKHKFYLNNNLSGCMLVHQLRRRIYVGAVKMIRTGPSTRTETAADTAEAFRAFYSTLYASMDTLGGDVLKYLEDTALTPLSDAEAT